MTESELRVHIKSKYPWIDRRFRIEHEGLVLENLHPHHIALEVYDYGTLVKVTLA